MASLSSSPARRLPRSPAHRLAYRSLIDFVPDVEPYEHLTVVDLQPVGHMVRVVMNVDPLHDQVWTRRLLIGRTNELDNLAEAGARRRAASIIAAAASLA